MSIYLRDFVHFGIFGSTGTGKTTLGELACEICKINDKMKIIDLQNDMYLEAIGFLEPTKIGKFAEFLEEHPITVDGKRIKPEAIETEIWHPIVKGLPKKLPKCIKLFTLPLDFFTYENVLRVLTNNSLTDSAYTTITQEIEKMTRSDSMPSLPSKILETVGKKIIKTTGLGEEDIPIFFYSDTSKSGASANRPFLKIKNVGVFASSKIETSLNDRKIKQILRERDKITAFSTRWIDQRHKKLKLAVTLYIFNKIRELSKSVGGETAIYIREARKIFPNSRISDPALKVLSEEGEDMAKDCRKAGIHLILDTQTPWDLADGVLDQLSLKFIFRHDKSDNKLLEMYMNSPGLDKERILRIKKLQDYHFFMSSPKTYLRHNPLHGMSMDYKITGHLEKNEDELRKFMKIFPKPEDWYDTAMFFEMLKADWRGSSVKTTKRVSNLYFYQEEIVKAKSLGILVSDMKVIIYLYLNRTDINGKWINEISRGIPLPYATVTEVLDRLYTKKYVVYEEIGNKIYYKITDTGIAFVEDNKKIFFPEGFDPEKDVSTINEEPELEDDEPEEE